MTIFDERLEDCLMMFMELLKINGETEIEIQGARYKLKTLTPEIYKELKKMILKDEESAEKILRFFSESYFYVTGMSDTFPEFEKV